MPKDNTPKQKPKEIATLEHQPTLYTRLTIQTRNQQERYNLVDQLKQEGYLFQRVPTEQEMERQAQEFANMIMIKTAGQKLLKAMESKSYWVKLMARIIWDKH
jgi:hypothetical protein